MSDLCGSALHPDADDAVDHLDREQRVYVQQKMLYYGADVWRGLEAATRIAEDVDDALTAIIRTHGGMNGEAARAYRREPVGAVQSPRVPSHDSIRSATSCQPGSSIMSCPISG